MGGAYQIGGIPAARSSVDDLAAFKPPKGARDKTMMARKAKPGSVNPVSGAERYSSPIR